MSVIYLNITENEFKSTSSVQKFMPLERALQLLKTRKLWFSNPVIWPDPFERRFIDGEYPGGKKFTWRNRVYCMCVTTNMASEASWKAYGDGYVVKLEFDRKELAKILDDFSKRPNVMDMFLGKMDYQQTKNIEKPLKQIKFTYGNPMKINTKRFKASLLLLKRKAYEYENEFRMIVVKRRQTKENGILIDIPNLMTLIKSIVIGPKVENYEYEMIKDHLITQYKFSKSKISQSNLYKGSANVKIKI